MMFYLKTKKRYQQHCEQKIDGVFISCFISFTYNIQLLISNYGITKMREMSNWKFGRLGRINSRTLSSRNSSCNFHL